MATTPSRSKAVQAEVFVQIQPVFDECLAGALRLDSQAVHLSVVLEVVLNAVMDSPHTTVLYKGVEVF
ncbi:hypothetical protein ACPA2M_20220 [Ectopseudomonas chengduensis]